MEILALIILFISWLLRAYGAVQEGRGPIDKPLIWHNSIAIIILIITWVVLLLLGSVMAFRAGGVLMLMLGLVLYFVIFPNLLGKLIKRLLNKSGF